MAIFDTKVNNLVQPLHIYSALHKYVNKTKARFHMPGHKGKNLPILQDSFLDCTELSYTDCLECPTDSILQAEKDIATIFDAKKSFLLTDGATCGIFVMVHTIKELGGKIAIARNSHKSVYNACSVLGVEPILFSATMQNGVIQQPSIVEIENLLAEHHDITAILLTTPDYYGNLIDLQKIQEICKQKNVLLFVDNAHGAFLQFDSSYKQHYAGRYADVWVDSLHKTTPCLTQGALLHTNNTSLIPILFDGLNIFRTTSPSYLIMASIEYAAKYMHQYGAEKIAHVRQSLAWATTELQKLKLTTYLGSNTLVLTVDFLKAGYNVDFVQSYLEDKGIFAELNDSRYLLFYCSTETDKSDMELLLETLRHAILNGHLCKTKENVLQDLERIDPIKVCSFTEVGRKKIEYLPLELAIGKIAARNIGRTPPCFPLIVAGEKITVQAIEQLKLAKHTFGMQNGLIPVIQF